MIGLSSTPSFTEFDPFQVPYQARVLTDMEFGFDYSLGVHEILLSGSVGSAKSILAAHCGIRHCLENERARLCLGRQSMPDLKDTILAKVLEHMEGDLVEGEDYEHNETKGKIIFSNGSEIVSRSWADKKFKRFRSLELSAAIVEELTENDDNYKPFYSELRARVGRLPHIKRNWVMCATNPDDPAHWAHKYFIESNIPTRHVYYSVTTDNKFLPEWYVKQLLTDLDPKLAERMVYGKWVSIAGDVIYYAYDKQKNFKDELYQVRLDLPIRVCFDFNIGEGKPMSATAMQYEKEKDAFHFFDEFIVEGANTEELVDEMCDRDLFEHKTHFVIHGDATGKNADTRSKRSDYDIIKKKLANYRRKDGSAISFETSVPLANPPVRKRHNVVNAYMRNALGFHRLFVYAKCKTLDEGWRLTKLKSGGQYIEDDSKRYQHVTTAAGYGIISTLNHAHRQPQGTREYL